MPKRPVARWEAKGGKRFVQLYHDVLGYSYETENGGGTLRPMPDDQAAIQYMERPWGAYGGGPVTVLKSDFPSTRRVN